MLSDIVQHSNTKRATKSIKYDTAYQYIVKRIAILGLLYIIIFRSKNLNFADLYLKIRKTMSKKIFVYILQYIRPGTMHRNL